MFRFQGLGFRNSVFEFLVCLGPVVDSPEKLKRRFLHPSLMTHVLTMVGYKHIIANWERFLFRGNGRFVRRGF